MPIELRHRTYFAYLDVPADVRAKLGRRVFRETLQTDSRSLAKRRAAVKIEQWKTEIARARDEPNHNDARYWRDQLRRAKDEDERQLILGLIDDAAWDIGAINVEHIGDQPSSDPEARRFYAKATGARVATADHLDEWIRSLQVKPKTANMRRTTIERLAAKFSTLQDINRGDVRRWVTELLETLEPATVRRMLSDCRSYWKYLATVEAVPEDSAPFDRLGLKVPAKHRQAWTPAELVGLHRAASGALADLILMAMYSGARLGELVNLRVADVAKDHFTIREAKTAAGRRQVPIHSELKRPLARMAEGKAPTDYVISGIKGQHRGGTMSKAFSRLRKGQGFTGKQDKTLHSIRNTVITMLEHAGVPEGTIQDIVGHERTTITGSVYSGKSTLAMRAAALVKARYP